MEVDDDIIDNTNNTHDDDMAGNTNDGSCQQSGFCYTARGILTKLGLMNPATKAVSNYQESSSEENKQKLATLLKSANPIWKTATEEMEVFRGQDSEKLDPTFSKVISTSQSMSTAMFFSGADAIMYSILVMPGIKYIDVQDETTWLTAMKNEKEIILEGGQDIYFYAYHKLDPYSLIILDKMNVVSRLVTETLANDVSIIRCLYAPKGTPINQIKNCIRHNPELIVTDEKIENYRNTPTDKNNEDIINRYITNIKNNSPFYESKQDGPKMFRRANIKSQTFNFSKSDLNQLKALRFSPRLNKDCQGGGRRHKKQHKTRRSKHQRRRKTQRRR